MTKESIGSIQIKVEEHGLGCVVLEVSIHRQDGTCIETFPPRALRKLDTMNVLLNKDAKPAKLGPPAGCLSKNSDSDEQAVSPSKDAAQATTLEQLRGAARSLPPGLWALVPKRQHITDGTPCWCEPELSHKDPATGAEVWVHREPQ